MKLLSVLRRNMYVSLRRPLVLKLKPTAWMLPLYPTIVAFFALNMITQVATFIFLF